MFLGLMFSVGLFVEYVDFIMFVLLVVKIMVIFG